jgi:predicted DNA-binding protein
MPTKITLVRLPSEVAAKVQTMADRKGLRFATMVRCIVAEKINKQKV